MLDYEENKEFAFFMLANDGGRFYEENKNYVTKIRVSLRDVNDNDPVFLKTPYAVEIMENQTDVVFVYQVSWFFLAFVTHKEFGLRGKRNWWFCWRSATRTHEHRV